LAIVRKRSTGIRRSTDHETICPDFAVAIYPGHLATRKGLNPNLPVSGETPPTLLVHAEDDHVDGVNQSLVYYTALIEESVPAEMHVYAHGGRLRIATDERSDHALADARRHLTRNDRDSDELSRTNNKALADARNICAAERRH